MRKCNSDFTTFSLKKKKKKLTYCKNGLKAEGKSSIINYSIINYMLFKRRGHSSLLIRTVCMDRNSSFRSVYDWKIASHFGVLDFNHVLFERRGHNGLSICTVWMERKRSLQSVYSPSNASHQVSEAEEIMNRRILPQQTSQIYMYTLFFKRERQHDPFRGKEIINQGILPQQTSQIYMYSSFFKGERQSDSFWMKEIMNRGILPQPTSQMYIKECELKHTPNVHVCM